MTFEWTVPMGMLQLRPQDARAAAACSLQDAGEHSALPR